MSVMEKKPGSFSQKVQATRPELLFLVRGRDNSGAHAWYYVMIDKGKEERFRALDGSSSLNLDEFGTILYSGFGENPPHSICEMVREEYGFEE